MTSIDEKIKFYKRDALILFLEGKYYQKIKYSDWEKVYLKELLEEKAKQEAECVKEVTQTI